MYMRITITEKKKEKERKKEYGKIKNKIKWNKIAKKKEERRKKEKSKKAFNDHSQSLIRHTCIHAICKYNTNLMKLRWQ